MKCSFSLLIILSLLLFTTSCTKYLIPSSLGNDIPYKQRPMLADSLGSIISIDAGIANSAGGLGNEGTTTLGYLNLNRGHTYKHINFSYGLYGYLGKVVKDNYEPNTTGNDVYLDNFNKTTVAIGIHSSIGFHDTSNRGNTDFRIINWENTITREFGDYLKFRKQLYGDFTYNNVLVSNIETVWTTGISTEIIFHSRYNKDFRHAFKLFLGGSPLVYKSFDSFIKKGNNDNHYDNDEHLGNLQFTYFFKYKNLNLTYQTDLARFSVGLGLGYAF